MTGAADVVAELLDLVIKLAANARREEQASIARQIDALPGRLASLPSLSADVRASVQRRIEELRRASARAEDDTRPVQIVPPEGPR